MALRKRKFGVQPFSDLNRSYEALAREARTSPNPYEVVIAVLTAKPMSQILKEGGTGAWTLNRKNARLHRFAVCVRKSDRPEENGTAFLIGRIKEVVTSPDDPDRWLITFSEYAPITVPESWKGWRNPVRYTDLNELSIDTSSIVFLPMPPIASLSNQSLSHDESPKLTIEQAKIGLSKTFGVPVDSIEIMIKG